MPAFQDIAGSRFSYLLATLIVLFLAMPLVEDHDTAMRVIGVLISAVLIASIYVGGRRRRDFAIAMLLVAPALIGRWLPQYGSSRTLFLAVSVATMAFLAYTVLVILAQIHRAERITLDAISGALCAYLLIGLFFAFAFSIIRTLQPGAFAFSQPGTVLAGDSLELRSGFMRLVYYSYVTLTTLGYGDIAPIMPASRAISAMEAIIGQFYVAVMVARLVGLQIVHSTRLEDSPRDRK